MLSRDGKSGSHKMSDHAVIVTLTKCHSVFFSVHLTGALELGKLATKLEFWEISHFNKPFRLEVCLRYLNNYNSSVNWRNKTHDNIT